MEQIVADEKIEADEKFVKEEITKMAEQYNRKLDEMEKNEELKSYLESTSKNEKAVKLILDNAKYTK